MNYNNNQLTITAPKIIPSDFVHFITVILPWIQTDAAGKNYMDFLIAPEPIRPQNLPANANDKAKKDRKDLQKDFDEPNGKFVLALKSITENSPYFNVIEPFLVKQIPEPLNALNAIRKTLIDESGLSSAKEIINRYIESFVLKGKFTDQGDLNQDLTFATSLINRCNQALTAGVPLPQNHPQGLPHPAALTEEEKASFLLVACFLS
jgi:hypothetical protein